MNGERVVEKKNDNSPGYRFEVFCVPVGLKQFCSISFELWDSGFKFFSFFSFVNFFLFLKVNDNMQ